MKKFLAILLLLCVGTMTAATDAPSPKIEQHKAMHWIVTTDKNHQYLGGCTANAISEHVLVTAEHCNMDVEDAGVIWVDKSKPEIVKGAVPYKVTEKYFDNEDHMLVVIPDAHFTDTIPYDFRPPILGERIYFWGNPAGIRDVYREGVMIGTVPVDPDKGVVTLYQVPVVGGDSGSTIFGEDGRAIGILTYGVFGGRMMGAYPVQFTPEQVAAAEGLHGASCAVEPYETVDEDGDSALVHRFGCKP